MPDEVRVPIASDADMIPARAHGRSLATELGFSRTDATLIATAISEIARNIIVHAGEGEIVYSPVYEDDSTASSSPRAMPARASVTLPLRSSTATPPEVGSASGCRARAG